LLIDENPDPAHVLLRREFIYPVKTRALGTGLELVAKRKDGSTFPVEIGINMIDTPEGKFAMAVIIDITQRRQHEDLLKKAHLNLQYYTRELQASNFELENFAYVSSHDLLEPLRKIRAFGDRLKLIEAGNISTQGHDYLDRVLHATDRMESLINDLLTFSRLSTRSQPFIAVDLNVILKEVINDLEVSIENTEACIEAGVLPVIDAEPTQIRQLFQNLIANAIKFRKISEPPFITISCTKNETDPGRESYDISFADNGIGFDEKYKEKVFNIFQTLAGRKYEGSGIGLAICRKIAIRHGGNIIAKSAVNAGSVFVVSLSAKQITPPQK
jgi:two-component system sensor kinase FixL